MRWISGSSALACCMLLVLLAGCTHQGRPASATIGTVTAVTGAPSLVHRSREYLVGKRSRIRRGNILETDRNAAVVVEMLDGSRLVLGPDSRLVFHEYWQRSARLTLTTGSVRVIPGRGEKQPRIRLQTPVAILESRGAEFLGGFIFGDNTLDVGLLSGGRLEVYNEHGSVRLRRSGEGTTVIGGASPQRSRPWTPGKLERMIAETAVSP